MSASGEFVWSVSLGTATLDWLVIDRSGATYAAGYFEDPTTVFGRDLTPRAIDALLVKLDASGQRLWLKQFGGAGDDYFQGAQLAQNGDLVLLGGQTGGTDFGGGPEQTLGELDDLVLALSPERDYRHSLVFGSPERDYVSDFVGNGSDTFGMTFWLPADMQIATEVLRVPQATSRQIGVARVRLGSAGFDLDWAVIAPYSSTSAALDPLGNIVLDAASHSQARVVKLGAQGQTLWSYELQGLEFIGALGCASTGEVVIGATSSVSTPTTYVETYTLGKLGK